MKNYLDDFAEWVPAPLPPPRFETAVPVPRRLQSLALTWRGQVYRFEPEDRLMLGARTVVMSRITVWSPTTDPAHPCPRHCWTADVLIRGYGFVEGTGETAQQALDALGANLPPTALTMVRGGSC